MCEGIEDQVTTFSEIIAYTILMRSQSLQIVPCVCLCTRVHLYHVRLLSYVAEVAMEDYLVRTSFEKAAVGKIVGLVAQLFVIT